MWSSVIYTFYSTLKACQHEQDDSFNHGLSASCTERAKLQTKTMYLKHIDTLIHILKGIPVPKSFKALKVAFDMYWYFHNAIILELSQ